MTDVSLSGEVGLSVRGRLCGLGRGCPCLGALRHVLWPGGLLARVVTVACVPTTVEVGLLAAVGTLQSGRSHTVGIFVIIQILVLIF